MSVIRDRDGMISAYEDVRNDSSATNWCCLKYDGSELVLESCGEDFTELKEKFGEDDRAFAYLRVQTGDEMSKRQKFVFISWIGPSLSGLKKAKTSTEKAFVKQIFSNFAIELTLDDINEVNEDKIKAEVMKAGGANYGTGN